MSDGDEKGFLKDMVTRPLIEKGLGAAVNIMVYRIQLNFILLDLPLTEGARKQTAYVSCMHLQNVPARTPAN